MVCVCVCTIKNREEEAEIEKFGRFSLINRQMDLSVSPKRKDILAEIAPLWTNRETENKIWTNVTFSLN